MYDSSKQCLRMDNNVGIIKNILYIIIDSCFHYMCIPPPLLPSPNLSIHKCTLMSYSHAPSTTFLLTVIRHYSPPGSICHIPTSTPVCPPLIPLNSRSCLSSGTSVTSIITPVVGHSLGTMPTAHKPSRIRQAYHPFQTCLLSLFKLVALLTW